MKIGSNLYDSAKTGSMFAHKHSSATGNDADTQTSLKEPSPEANTNEDDPASDSFGNEDEIEEYIRKHLDEEASKDKDDQMKAKLMLA